MSLYKRVRGAVAARYARTGVRTAGIDDIIYELGWSASRRATGYHEVRAEMRAMADYGDGVYGVDVGGNSQVTFTGTIVKSEDRVGILVYAGRSITVVPDGALADLSVEWVTV